MLCLLIWIYQIQPLPLSEGLDLLSSRYMSDCCHAQFRILSIARCTIFFSYRCQASLNCSGLATEALQDYSLLQIDSQIGCRCPTLLHKDPQTKKNLKQRIIQNSQYQKSFTFAILAIHSSTRSLQSTGNRGLQKGTETYRRSRPRVDSVKRYHIVPHIKFDRIGGTSSATFPNFRYVALERSVLKEIVWIALLQNESWNTYFMLRVAGQYPNSARCYLLSLDGAAYFKY